MSLDKSVPFVYKQGRALKYMKPDPVQFYSGKHGPELSQGERPAQCDLIMKTGRPQVLSHTLLCTLSLLLFVAAAELLTWSLAAGCWLLETTEMAEWEGRG